jgi:hypothetical protein
MGEMNDFKKFFLIALIVSMIVGALTSIFIFLFGEFSEVEIRILLTTLSIAVASLIGFFYSKIRTDYVRILGLIALGLMFLITLFSIWELTDGEVFLRGLGVYLVLIVLLAQAPWILKHHSKKIIRIAALTTFIFASILALMSILLIMEIAKFQEFYYRLLGVFGVLYLLGLVLIPILKKLVHETPATQSQVS